MKRPLAALAVFGLLLTSVPAVRADDAKPQKTPEQLVSEGVQMLIQAMQLFLQSVPQFGEPYVNDNGDIVIPRLHPDQDKEKPKPAPPKGDGNRRI